MSRTVANYFLNLKLGTTDKARMHDLAVRNQSDLLTPEEKEELFAYARAGAILSVLRIEAELALRPKVKKRTPA